MELEEEEDNDKENGDEDGTWTIYDAKVRKLDERVRRDPGLRLLVEQEMRRILECAEKGLDSLMDTTSASTLEKQAVRVGCCDAAYPGFKEVRMVLIDLDHINDKKKEE